MGAGESKYHNEAMEFAEGLWKEVRHKYYRHKNEGKYLEADEIEADVKAKIRSKYPQVSEGELRFISYISREGNKAMVDMGSKTAMGFLLDGKPPKPGEDFVFDEEPTEQDDTEDIVDLTPAESAELGEAYKKNREDNTIGE